MNNLGDKANTNGFNKNPQNINREGRKPKLVKHLNSELLQRGYETVTQSDITDAIKIILNMPMSLVIEITKNEKDEYPFLFQLIATELTGKRAGEALERLLNRTFNKVSEANKQRFMLLDSIDQMRQRMIKEGNIDEELLSSLHPDSDKWIHAYVSPNSNLDKKSKRQ
jgi:ribosomal 50S subunit-associated protein YjgA (DUF615 family)